MKTWMIILSSMILGAVVEVSAQSAPPVPTLNTPAPAAINVAISSNLVWNASTGATSYRVQLASDSLFTALLVDDSTVATTTRAVGPLANSTTYYWRVNAKSAGGTSAFSASQSFTTLVAAPGAPTLTAPAQNATNVAVSSTLTWAGTARATSYHIQLGTDSTFATTVVNDSTDTTNSLAVSLVNGTTYYWHVSAANLGGVSAYSTRRNFNTFPDTTPATPTLTAPAQNAANEPDSLALTWAAAAGATSYRVQVSKDSTFSSTFVVNDSTVTTTTRSVTGLTNADTLYWRVNAKNAFGTSAFSTRRVFTTLPAAAPAAPTLTAPAQNAANEPDSLALTWAASVGAVTYRVQVSKDSTFSSTFVVNDSTVITNTRNVTGLTNGDTLYWRVNAKNTFGTSAFSTRRVFTTVPATAPAVPTLTAPAQNAANEPDSLALTWAASVGAATYRVQVSKDSTFSSTFVVNDSTVTTTTRSVTGLTNADTLYWRVNAKNAFGTSAFSTRRVFTTIPATAPAAPTLTAPAQNAVNQPDSLNLTWAASLGATSYRVQLSKDSTFSSTFVVNDSTVTTPTRFVTGLTSADTLYWRVNAKNAFGTSAFSTRRNFSTATLVAPATPTLTAPAQNAVNIAVSTNLTWNALATATSYHVQLGTDSTFATTLIDDSVLTKDTLAVSLLANGTVYYWHVSAKNSVGTSAFSTRRNFTTMTAVPPAPTLSSPAQNAIGVFIPTTLVWNASAGAVTYHVQLSKDSTFTTVAANDSGVVGTSQAITSIVNDGSIYYWRVNATNTVGTSDYSARGKFTLLGVPLVPGLSTPANNATGVALSTTLTWVAVPTATAYRVQLSSDSTFGSTLVDDSTVTTTSRAVGPFPGSTTLYWRVAARDTVGSSAFSTTRNYTTTLGVPTGPTLSTPLQGATGVALSPTLTWNASAGAKTYRVELTTDSTFLSAFIVNDSTVATTSRAVGPLTVSTHYYWRVNAKDSLGTSSFSAVRSFVTTAVVAILPQTFSLERLSANQGNALQFALPTRSHVDITLFDSQGRMQQKLLDGTKDAGIYTIPLPAAKLSGAYYLDFRADAIHKTLLLNF